MLKTLKAFPLRDCNAFFPERSLKLHSMLINCGHQRVDSSSYSWNGLRRGNRDFFIWQYTISGRGALKSGDCTYSIEPEQAMLLTIPDDHCYYFPEGSTHWEFIFLTLYGSEIIRLAHELKKHTGAVTKFSLNSPPVHTAVAILEKFFNNTVSSKYTTSSLAYEFMMNLLEYTKPSISGSGKHPEFINRVYDYCLKNIEREITIDNMAKIAGYSRYHFSRMFRSYQGMSPMEFVTDLKMKMAVRMLQNEALTVKEIAGRCGFEDVSYFCKVFKKNQGVPPGGFRAGQETE
ncbi:MAG: AraC family transcriptional regulator [Victivallaceae bacterium]